MQILRNDAETAQGPGEWFTGAVFVDALTAPDRFMTHLSLVEVQTSEDPATWGEHVTDDEYGTAPTSEG